MRTALFTILILTFTTLSFGQTVSDHNSMSKEILAKVSDNYQQYPSMKFAFTLNINSQDFNEEQEGFAVIKDEKFYYETTERKVICDGKVVWTVITDDDECYIDNLSDLDNTINPSEIFSIWKTGFNYKYVKKEDKNHFIKMFPQNPDQSKYHTIIMKVDESSNTIKQSTVKTKDGVNIKITITNLTGNPVISKNTFYWVESENPNIDVIDNR
ncbi:MAG: outer membrane lipoprotein carrier protein LolA [Bacteroidota bacterium]|nr:outer membrane lipoprotein carrier protein LolA [Bacteroidota bacterium]